LDGVAELVVAVDRGERELDAAPGSAQLVEEELGTAHHGLGPSAQTATREAEPVVQLARLGPDRSLGPKRAPIGGSLRAGADWR
jgi:hypothetical protein